MVAGVRPPLPILHAVLNRAARVILSPGLSPLRGSSKFDGSKLKDGHASCGFVVRDDCGEVVVAGAKALGSSTSILQAEAWGLREGVKAALDLARCV